MRITIRDKNTPDLPLDQRTALATLMTLYYTSYAKQRRAAQNLTRLRDAFPDLYKEGMAKLGVEYSLDKAAIVSRALEDVRWMMREYFSDLDIVIEPNVSTPGEPVDIE